MSSGYTLRKVPGVRPQTTWQFVRAPLGWCRGRLYVYDTTTERGVVYISARDFKDLRARRAAWKGHTIICANIELTPGKPTELIAKRSGTIGVPELNEFDAFYLLASTDDRMMEAAYSITAFTLRYAQGMTGELRRKFLELTQDNAA